MQGITFQELLIVFDRESPNLKEVIVQPTEDQKSAIGPVRPDSRMMRRTGLAPIAGQRMDGAFYVRERIN